MDCVARVFKRLIAALETRSNRLPLRKRWAGVRSPAILNTWRCLVPTRNTFHTECGQTRLEAQP